MMRCVVKRHDFDPHQREGAMSENDFERFASPALTRLDQYLRASDVRSV